MLLVGINYNMCEVCEPHSHTLIFIFLGGWISGRQSKILYLAEFCCKSCLLIVMLLVGINYDKCEVYESRSHTLIFIFWSVRISGRHSKIFYVVEFWCKSWLLIVLLLVDINYDKCKVYGSRSHILIFIFWSVRISGRQSKIF